MRAVRPDVALAATLHDPTGALAGEVCRLLPRLCALYARVAVATSPPTAPRLRTLLARAGAYAGTPAQNTRGPLYRLALRRALARGVPRVHYVDFDRALHWLRRAPRELEAVLRAARRRPVLLLGRTPAAHRSHQRPLYATETVVNRLLAGRAGLAGRVDLLVPAFVLDAAHVRTLLARSRARDAAIYGEWAALLLGLEPEMAYLECRGLDWETPDRDRRRSAAAWRRRLDTPAEWRLRTALAAEFVRGFSRALARRPLAPPRLVRLPQRAS
ncbi:MAG TPA: hypothetical protein VKW76_15665 [Candidatus Binatia bacterium]|nr:hypothetical protein [Candidatus Binatia bacterium]